MYIEFCKCGRQILTTGQMNNKQPCGICQKELADVDDRNPQSQRNNPLAKRIGTNNINNS